MANRTERYLYRCTSDKLMTHIALIEESGDQVEWPIFMGGRDWWLICRKVSVDDDVSAQLSATREVLVRLTADTKAIADAINRGGAAGSLKGKA